MYSTTDCGIKGHNSDADECPSVTSKRKRDTPVVPPDNTMYVCVPSLHVVAFTKVAFVTFSPSPLMLSGVAKRLKRCDAWGKLDPRWGESNPRWGEQENSSSDSSGSSDHSSNSSSDSSGPSDHSSNSLSDASGSSHDALGVLRAVPQDVSRLLGGILDVTWGRDFVPLLIAWAGAKEDPFSIKNGLYAAVANIWSQIFPRVVLNGDAITMLADVVGLIKSTI